MNASKIAQVLESAHNEDIFFDYNEFEDYGNFYENRITEVVEAMEQSAKLIQQLRAQVIVHPINIERIRELLLRDDIGEEF